jgi:hypothetical protein
MKLKRYVPDATDVGTSAWKWNVVSPLGMDIRVALFSPYLIAIGSAAAVFGIPS